jgi:hypothetical protein
MLAGRGGRNSVLGVRYVVDNKSSVWALVAIMMFAITWRTKRAIVPESLVVIACWRTSFHCRLVGWPVFIVGRRDKDLASSLGFFSHDDDEKSAGRLLDAPHIPSVRRWYDAIRIGSGAVRTMTNQTPLVVYLLPWTSRGAAASGRCGVDRTFKSSRDESRRFYLYEPSCLGPHRIVCCFPSSFLTSFFPPIGIYESINLDLSYSMYLVYSYPFKMDRRAIHESIFHVVFSAEVLRGVRQQPVVDHPKIIAFDALRDCS